MLLITIMSSITVFDVGAQAQFRCIGDVDGDDKVTIIDATYMQRYLASMVDFSRLQRFLADVNGDQKSDIVDVTEMQKKLASLGSFYRERIDVWRSEILSVKCTENEDNYFINTEYHFVINCEDHEIPDEFRILIDDEVLVQRTEEKLFTYSFTDSGAHTVKVYCFDAFGGVSSYQLNLIAKDSKASESPRVTSLNFNQKNHLVTVAAEGGKAPYLFAFTIRMVQFPAPESPEQIPAYSSNFILKVDDVGLPYLYCDFCSGKNVFVPTRYLSSNLYYDLEAQAMDANGILSEVKIIQIKK